MFFKHKVLPFFLVLLLAFVVVAKPAAAVTISEQNRTSIFAQIERLQAEVVKLQALLIKLQNESIGKTHLSDHVPHESVLFPVPYESTYFVENGRLYSMAPGEVVTATEAKLFALFVDTFGEENVAKYVREWRVFYKPGSDLGAFVEYIPAEEAWLIGVNREGFVASDVEVATSFANLFVHELAHILLFEKPEFETKFKEEFWTEADTLHAEVVERATIVSRFLVLNRYYQKNTTRFVGDYATLSASEDLAETFLAFVREKKPLGSSIREQKIRTFYTDAELVSQRSVLRTNLSALGAL
jgi:hypothetical protein